MTGRRLGLIAALGSLGIMIAALGFQYIGDLPPCKMCYWQRYPHITAIGIGVLFLFFAYRGLLLLGALVARHCKQNQQSARRCNNNFVLSFVELGLPDVVAMWWLGVERVLKEVGANLVV